MHTHYFFYLVAQHFPNSHFFLYPCGFRVGKPYSQNAKIVSQYFAMRIFARSTKIHKIFKTPILRHFWPFNCWSENEHKKSRLFLLLILLIFILHQEWQFFSVHSRFSLCFRGFSAFFRFFHFFTFLSFLLNIYNIAIRITL